MLLGSGEQRVFRPEEFGAYYRRVRSRLERVRRRPSRRPSRTRTTTAASATSSRSATRGGTRSTTSAASPGIRRRQIERLAAAGITTLAALGRAPAEPPPPGIAPETFAKIREQAELQLWAREHGRDRFVLLAAAAGERASRCCPIRRRATSSSTSRATRSGTSDGSLEYLWGILDVDRALHAALGARPRRPSGSRSSGSSTSCTSGSRASRTCTSTTTPPTRSPRCKRLMGRYGTREDELDDLLRRGVFVDLYKVVRNGLRASRPGYGLKEMETFLDFRPPAPRCRTAAPRSSIFEEWMQTRDQALLDADRRLQPRGLRRDAAAARLAARAAGGGARAVRAVPAAGAGRAEAGAAGEASSARRCARRCSDAGEELARAAARLPRPRAQAGLVGVLRPARDDARGARRGRRLDRRPRAHRRAGAGEALAGVHAHLPGAGAQDRPGPGHVRPATRAGRPARSSSSTATGAGSC